MLCWTWHVKAKSERNENEKKSYFVIKTNYQFVYLRKESENQHTWIEWALGGVVFWSGGELLLWKEREHSNTHHTMDRQLHAKKGWKREGCVNELNFISMRKRRSSYTRHLQSLSTSHPNNSLKILTRVCTRRWWWDWGSGRVRNFLKSSGNWLRIHVESSEVRKKEIIRNSWIKERKVNEEVSHEKIALSLFIENELFSRITFRLLFLLFLFASHRQPCSSKHFPSFSFQQARQPLPTWNSRGIH